LAEITEISLKVKFDLIPLICCEVNSPSLAGSQSLAEFSTVAITWLLHSKKHQNNVSSATAFVGKGSSSKGLGDRSKIKDIISICL
jgi:hypothetical protein